MRRCPSPLRFSLPVLALASGALALAGCSRASEPLVLMVPSSLEQSGFLEFLIPQYQGATGRQIQIVAASTRSETPPGADVVISYDTEREDKLLEDGSITFYRKFMFDGLFLAGPADDPAGVRQATSIADAFQRIAAHGVPFISRADGSASDAREQRLRAAAVPAMHVEEGGDMVATLREASARGAYCLAHGAVFERLREQLDLVPLFARDDELLNTYAVMVTTRGGRSAQDFAEWLAEGQGRVIVENFRIGSRRPFSVWPVTAPARTPDAIPMY